MSPFFLKMYWFFCPSVRFSAYKVAIKFPITNGNMLRNININGGTWRKEGNEKELNESL